MTKRIYLSGPMTGIPDHNFPAFNEWAARLRAQGHEVVSPAELSEGKTWAECLRVDIRELCGCDAIALMPGWEASKGANLELHVAHRLELEVIPLMADEAARVDENCPNDVFENAIRRYGVTAACEWFGYGPRDPFTESTRQILRERADNALARLVKPVPTVLCQDKIRARFEARYKGPQQ